MLEALGAALMPGPKVAMVAGRTMLFAWRRTCYDHLAGQLAILLTRAWIDLRCPSRSWCGARIDGQR